MQHEASDQTVSEKHLTSEEQALALHAQVRELVRQQLAPTNLDRVLSPALMAETLKRLIEQVTGAPVPPVADEERPVFGKRLQ